MDLYASYYSGGYPHQGFKNSSWGNNVLKNLKKINLVTQNHLKKVYLSFSCSLAEATVGDYLHILLNIGGFRIELTWIDSILGLLSILNFKLTFACLVCSRPTMIGLLFNCMALALPILFQEIVVIFPVSKIWVVRISARCG